MVEMFCPHCKGLLKPGRIGGATIKRCMDCGYELRQGVQKARSIPQKPKHPGFPLFPYDEIRGGQREFMADIMDAAIEGKVLLAQAPTGIGKTVATLSTLLEVALTSPKMILFLTSKQSQHTIVIETLRDIAEASGRRIKAVDIIARQAMCPDAPPGMPGYAFKEFCKLRIRSHSCPYNENPADEAQRKILGRIMHVHELQKVCMTAGVCPHKAAQEAMADANVVVCDYNYIFEDIAGPILEKTGKGRGDLILVVDEAHNLPDRIRDNMSVELTSYGLSEAVREAGGTGMRGYRYTRALKRALDGSAEKLPENGEEYFEKALLENELEKSFSEVLGEKDTLEAYIKWLGDLGAGALKAGAERSFALELGDFVDKWASVESGVTRIFSRGVGDFWTLRLAFLEAETAAGPILSEVSAAVLMSGTLCPPDMYADILGVPEEKRMGRIYESPFPKENRKILGLRGITTQYTRRDDAMYEDYAERLAALADNIVGNVAAFFPSYRYMEDVAAKLDGKLSRTELIVESRSMTKRDRENVVGRLRDGKPVCLMLAVQGGGLSEGIDYEGNILSAIAVIGLPLAPPNLEVRALVGHFVSKFGEERGNLYGYTAPAINKVVQSAGRLIRSEKDRGVVVLMDERFGQARYATLLPPEMRPKMLGSREELIAELRLFFDKGKVKALQPTNLLAQRPDPFLAKSQ
jgi:DNA excision repair protein ERCC-2